MPGIPTEVRAPRVPIVCRKPRPPNVNDVPLLPMFHRTPGRILKLFLNRKKPTRQNNGRGLSRRKRRRLLQHQNIGSSLRLPLDRSAELCFELCDTPARACSEVREDLWPLFEV